MHTVTLGIVAAKQDTQVNELCHVHFWSFESKVQEFR